MLQQQVDEKTQTEIIKLFNKLCDDRTFYTPAGINLVEVYYGHYSGCSWAKGFCQAALIT